jgi:ribA/ribD-fused uncharacterized protein
MKDDFVFFWGSSSPFSNWHPAEFIVDGVKYNCSEQYMMVQKAIMFKDDETAVKVMETTNPREQKALGRQVRGFNAERWLSEALEIVTEGLVFKFGSSQLLYEALMATGDKIIVEASPIDKIWGIGLSASDPRAWDQSTWEGTNLLGQALMKARAILSALGSS